MRFTPKSPSLIIRGLLLLALAGLSACRMAPGAESQFLVEVTPGNYSHFAWLDEAISERSDLDAEIHREVEAQMARIGQTKTDLSRAEYFVTYDTTMVTEQRRADPRVSNYVGELVEIGVLTIELLDVQSGEAIWRGSQRGKLRRSAVLYGGATSNNYSPTDSPREWNISKRAEAILASLEDQL